MFPFGGVTARVALAAAAGATDWLDGIIARRFGATSIVGGLLDACADKLFVVIAFVTLAAEGALPWWAVGLVLARDLVVGGAVLSVVLRREWEAFRHMPSNRFGKAATLAQFGLLGIVLLAPRATLWAVPAVALVSALAGTTYLQRLVRGRRGAEPA